MSHIAVVGGGLAGITAALDLADRGEQVTLLESRARLGGLTTSFRRGEMWVDNGQHVFMRCCTAYRDLLTRLGVADLVTLQRRLRLDIRSEATPETSTLRRVSLPVPLHLAGALLRHPWMPLRDRLQAGRVALALRRVDRTTPQADNTSFGAWLHDQGCSPRAVATLWDLVGLATLNAHTDDASLSLAATVFQLGLLDRPGGADLGWALVPLHRLHGQPAAGALHQRGVTVLLRSRVRDLAEIDGRWQVATSSGLLDVDQVVLAVPPNAAASLVPAAALSLSHGYETRLGSSPIVNLHLVLDRPVLDVPLLAAVDSPLQWLFDRTASSGLTDGQYIVASLSAADEILRQPVSQLQSWARHHLMRLLPDFDGAQVRDFFVTREPHATFRPAPGCGIDRPRARTTRAGLAVAGAWTDTGWPATMEGAVRSGHAAAQALAPTATNTRDEVAV